MVTHDANARLPTQTAWSSSGRHGRRRNDRTHLRRRPRRNGTTGRSIDRGNHTEHGGALQSARLKGKYILTGIGIAISSFFIAAIVVLTNSLRATVNSSVGDVSRAEAVVASAATNLRR